MYSLQQPTHPPSGNHHVFHRHLACVYLRFIALPLDKYDRSLINACENVELSSLVFCSKYSLDLTGHHANLEAGMTFRLIFQLNVLEGSQLSIDEAQQTEAHCSRHKRA
jgi:hypothetical protein